MNDIVEETFKDKFPHDDYESIDYDNNINNQKDNNSDGE